MSKLSKFKQQVACFHVIFIASNMYCEKMICRIARIETPDTNDKNVFLPIIPVWILQGLERKSYSCKVETFIEELDETTPETEFALRFSCNTGRLLRTPTADHHCNTDKPLHTPTADNHCNTDRPLHTPTADNHCNTDRPLHTPTADHHCNTDKPLHTPTADHHYTQKRDASFRYSSRFDIDVFDERVFDDEIKCTFNPVNQKKSIDSRGLNERFFGDECKHPFLGAGHPMPFQLTTLEENLCENSCGLRSIRLQHSSLINTNFPKEKCGEDKRDCFYTHIQQLWEFNDGRFTEDKSEYTDTHIRQPMPVETKSVDDIFCMEKFDGIFCMEKFEDINLILRNSMPHDFSACISRPFIVDSKVMKSHFMRRKWDNTLSANHDDMLFDIINDQNNNGNSNEHDSDDRKAELFKSSVSYYCSSLAMPESVKPVDEIQQLFTGPNESFPKNDNVQKLLVNYIALIHLLATSDYRQQLYSRTPVKTGSHEWEDTKNVDNKDKSLSWNEQCIVLHTDKCTIEDNHLLCHEKSTITTVDSHLECEGKRSSTYEDSHWSCKDQSDIPAADNDWNESKMKKLYLFLCLTFCVLKLLLQVEYKKVVHDVNKTRDGTSSVCQRSDGALRKDVTHGSQGKHTRRGYTFLANEHILTGADKRYTVAKVRNVTDIKRQKNSAMKSQDRVADNTRSLTSNQLLCSSAMLLSRRMNVLQNMDVVVYCCLHLEENNDENLAPYLPSSFVKDDLGLGLMLHFTKPISTRIQLHDSHFAFKALYQASFSHRRVNFSSDSWALMYRLRTQIWGSLGPMEIARPISQSKGEIDIKWVFQMQKSVRMALAAKVHDSPLRPSLLPQVLQCSRYGFEKFPVTVIHVKTVFRYQHSFRGGIACSLEEFQITESDGNDADRPDQTQNTKNDSSKQNQQGDSFDDQGSSGDNGDHDDGNSSAGGGGGSDGGGGGGGGDGRKDDDDDSPDGHHRDDTQTRNQLVKLLKCLLQWFYMLHPLSLTFSANLHNQVKVPSTWCFIRRQLLSILNSFSSSNVNFKLRLRIAQHCVKEFSTKMAQVNWTKVRRIRGQNCCLWVYYLIDDSDNTDDEHTEHSDPSPGPPDTQGLSAMDGTSTIGSITRQRTSSSSDSRNGNNGLVPENNPGILGLGENQHNGNDNEDTQLLQRLEDLLHRSQSPQLLALTWYPVETPRLPIQCTDSEYYRHSDQAPGATFDVYVEPTHRIQIKLRGDKVLTSFTQADLNRVYTDARDETISMRQYLPIEETQPPLGELNGPIRQPGNILMEDLSIVRRRQYRLLHAPDTVTSRTVNQSGRVYNSNSHRRSFQESHPHPDSRTVPCPGNTSIENLPFVRESQNRQILPPHPSTNTTGNETGDGEPRKVAISNSHRRSFQETRPQYGVPDSGTVPLPESRFEFTKCNKCDRVVLCERFPCHHHLCTICSNSHGIFTPTIHFCPICRLRLPTT